MTSTDINSLVEKLKSNDGIARQHARHDLVEIGAPALDALIKAFEIKEDPLHWEVAKALSQIGTSKAAHTLVEALEDQEFSVRWIGAEGLIHIGEDAVIPLLKALEYKTDSVWLREGCHHVLHDMLNRKLIKEKTRECVIPVLKALNHFDPAVQANTAAIEALRKLEG